MGKNNNGKSTAAGELKLIEQRISALRGSLRALVNEQNDPAILDKEIGFHLEKIEFHKAQIEKLNLRRSNNGADIAKMQENIRLANKTRSRLVQAKALEKLLKLRNDIRNFKL